MSPISITTGILISPIADWDNQGGVAPAVTTGFLLENGTDFILLETGDYLLQES